MQLFDLDSDAANWGTERGIPSDESVFVFEGTGAILTYMSCPPEAAAANVQRMLDLQRRVEREGISETELAQAKSKICSRIVLRSERGCSKKRDDKEFFAMNEMNV